MIGDVHESRRITQFECPNYPKASHGYAEAETMETWGRFGVARQANIRHPKNEIALHFNVWDVRIQVRRIFIHEDLAPRKSLQKRIALRLGTPIEVEILSG